MPEQSKKQAEVEKISVVGVWEKNISSAAVEIPVRFENSILVRFRVRKKQGCRA